MVIRCLKNELDNAPFLILPTHEDGVITFDDFVLKPEYCFQYKEFCKYALTINKEYIVYGILQYNGQLRYLIQNDYDNTAFFLSELFDICEPSVPFEWTVATFELEEGTLLILGYEGITKSYEGLCDLIENKSHAMQKFLDYKAWVRKWIQKLD